MQNWGTGVTDAVRQKISPEAGAKLQIADETAMRQNTLDSQEFVETKAMRRVSNLFDTDDKFAGMVLDFARKALKAKKLLKNTLNKRLIGALRNRAFRFDSSVDAFNNYMELVCKEQQ